MRRRLVVLEHRGDEVSWATEKVHQEEAGESILRLIIFHGFLAVTTSFDDSGL